MSPQDSQAGTGRARPLVLVTGATRGIGAAICRDLIVDHDLIVGGTKPDSVRSTCEQLGQGARPLVVDLADEEATIEAVEALGLSRLDALVHNAGVAGGWTTEQSRREYWRWILELNVIAVSELTRLCLPALRFAAGTVVTINSGAGLRASGQGGHYPASKFALTALSDVLRDELRPQGIRVCSIHPGQVDTDMQRQGQEDSGHPYQAELYLRPESVAAAVRLAVDATEDATFETIAVRPSPWATAHKS